MNVSRLKATQIIVISSIILSCCSFFTVMKGYGEIYPFFFWKLFSQPIGSSGTDSVLRLYVKDGSGKLKRLPNQEKKSFTKDDFAYALGFYVKDTTSQGKERLSTFCRFLHPEYDTFYVIQETYNARRLIENSTDYDTLTVVKIP